MQTESRIGICAVALRSRFARNAMSVALITAAFFLPGSAASLRASMIGVDFAAGSPSQALPPGVSAGVVPQTNWNVILTSGASGLVLTNDSGAATTATLTFSAPSAAGTYSGLAAGGDELLNTTWIANFSGTSTFSIASIPYATYDLVIYNLPLFNNAFYTYSVSGLSYYGRSPSNEETSAGYVDGNIGTPYNYTLASSTNSGSPTLNSDYAVFEDLTGSSLTFSVIGGNGVSYINGFQLVEVVIPEPTAMFVLAAASLAIAVLRWRRRA